MRAAPTSRRIRVPGIREGRCRSFDSARRTFGAGGPWRDLTRAVCVRHPSGASPPDPFITCQLGRGRFHLTHVVTPRSPASGALLHLGPRRTTNRAIGPLVELATCGSGCGRCGPTSGCPSGRLSGGRTGADGGRRSREEPRRPLRQDRGQYPRVHACRRACVTARHGHRTVRRPRLSPTEPRTTPIDRPNLMGGDRTRPNHGSHRGGCALGAALGARSSMPPGESSRRDGARCRVRCWRGSVPERLCASEARCQRGSVVSRGLPASHRDARRRRATLVTARYPDVQKRQEPPLGGSC